MISPEPVHNPSTLAFEFCPIQGGHVDGIYWSPKGPMTQHCEIGCRRTPRNVLLIHMQSASSTVCTWHCTVQNDALHSLRHHGMSPQACEPTDLGSTRLAKVKIGPGCHEDSAPQKPHRGRDRLHVYQIASIIDTEQTNTDQAPRKQHALLCKPLSFFFFLKHLLSTRWPNVQKIWKSNRIVCACPCAMCEKKNIGTSHFASFAVLLAALYLTFRKSLC